MRSWMTNFLICRRIAGTLLLAGGLGGLLFVASCRLFGENAALDRILLGEKAYEVGAMIFDHRLHSSLRGSAGEGIACVRCHHTYRGLSDEPPKACGSCHLSHSDGRTSDLPYL